MLGVYVIPVCMSVDQPSMLMSMSAGQAPSHPLSRLSPLSPLSEGPGLVHDDLSDATTSQPANAMPSAAPVCCCSAGQMCVAVCVWMRR